MDRTDHPIAVDGEGKRGRRGYPTHVGRKRDLDPTLFAGQELPEVLFGGSSLELSLDGGGGGDGEGEGEGDRNSGERIGFVRRMHRGARQRHHRDSGHRGRPRPNHVRRPRRQKRPSTSAARKTRMGLCLRHDPTLDPPTSSVPVPPSTLSLPLVVPVGVGVAPAPVGLRSRSGSCECVDGRVSVLDDENRKRNGKG